jgi:hypothetical protein
VLERATELRGDPELPGLILDLRSVWCAAQRARQAMRGLGEP